MRVLPALCFKLFIGVKGLRIINQIIPEGMSDGVGECCLFTHQNGFGNQMILFKGMTDQILADPVLVELFLRIDVHDIIHEIQITERNAGLQRIDGNAAVRTENIVDVDLADAFLCFLLEGFCAGSKIRIFVAEQFIGNLARQNHADVCVLMNPLADEIHADGGPDGCDIEGAEGSHNRLQGSDDIIAGDDHFVVVGMNVFRHLACVFQINGVNVHADGEGLQRLVHEFCGGSADQRRVESAGQKIPDRSIGIQTLLNAAHQLVVNVHGDGLQIILVVVVHGAHIPVGVEGTVLIIAAGRERKNPVTQTDQVLRLGSEDDDTIFIVSIIQRTNADRIAGGDVLLRPAVVENQCILCIEQAEHIDAVFFI